jgi:hypothetical protein
MPARQHTIRLRWAAFGQEGDRPGLLMCWGTDTEAVIERTGIWPNNDSAAQGDRL